MKKTAIILNIIFAALIIVGDILFITFGGLLLKSLTSTLFVLQGGMNLFFAIKLKTNLLKFCIFLVVGLVFAMLGDIFLNAEFAAGDIEFIIGAILFAIGHVFFFTSYCFVLKFRWLDLVYGAAIALPSILFITLAPIFNFGGIVMEILCIVYAIVISLMVGKALSNLVKNVSILNIIILVGSVLFFISDLMLLLNMFGGLPRFVDIICLATYYPAETLLAFSVLCATNIFTKEK